MTGRDEAQAFSFKLSLAITMTPTMRKMNATSITLSPSHVQISFWQFKARSLLLTQFKETQNSTRSQLNFCD